jgi:hypothetical protein
MTRRELWKRLGIGAILIVIPVMAFAPPLVYFGKEIRGKVLDADTGAPLAGVSIVAEWQIYVMVVQSHLGNRIKVIEATTGFDGNYVVPGWGPVVRPPWGALLNHSPKLTFFKAGYYPKVVLNERESESMIRDSEFNGREIRLKQFDGDLDLLDRLLEVSSPWLTGCWRDCPHYVVALDAEAKRLRPTVPRTMFFSFPQELDLMSPGDRAFFLQFKK